MTVLAGCICASLQKRWHFAEVLAVLLVLEVYTGWGCISCSVLCKRVWCSGWLSVLVRHYFAKSGTELLG